MKVSFKTYLEEFLHLAGDDPLAPEFDVPDHVYARYCAARDEWQRVQALLDQLYQKAIPEA